VRLTATPRYAGGHVSALHCNEIAAELTFRNQVGIQLSVFFKAPSRALFPFAVSPVGEERLTARSPNYS